MLPRVMFCAACVSALAACASAQMDGDKFTAEFRQRYGPTLTRETFTARPGLEMIVDFAPNGYPCRIQLPPIAPSTGPGQEGVRSQKAIYDFVTELLPLPLRTCSINDEPE